MDGQSLQAWFLGSIQTFLQRVRVLLLPLVVPRMVAPTLQAQVYLKNLFEIGSHGVARRCQNREQFRLCATFSCSQGQQTLSLTSAGDACFQLVGQWKWELSVSCPSLLTEISAINNDFNDLAEKHKILVPIAIGWREIFGEWCLSS
ncbi:hypothetical protein BS78_07G216300 [Paspalum vaginatum]|nr:hypothetical protein BS78_07G216300 [Paspalum vaginatum]